MNFFNKILKFPIYPSFSSEFHNSVNSSNRLEKLIFFHDRGAFSLLFILSIFTHIILLLIFGIMSELFAEDPPPIRARISVSYAKIPSKPTLKKTSNSLIETPILKKLDTNLKPKNKRLAPRKPLLKKPSLKSSLKKSNLPKPAFKKTESPRIKISKPQIIQPLSDVNKNRIQKPKLFNSSKKPILLKENPPKSVNNTKKVPALNKKTVPLSPIKSKDVILKPKTIEVPRFAKEKFSQKKLDPSNFSKTFKPSKQKNPTIGTDNLKDITKIPNLPSIKPHEPIDNLLSVEQKKDAPLPENIIIPENNNQKDFEPMPVKDLQKRQETLLAIDDYNTHIRNQIIPNGKFPSGLFVRFLLTIIQTGEITKYEIIEKSGFAPLDLAAELAVKKAILDELPAALAANPPYIVEIRIIPKNKLK